jgi:hypothetical protein
MHFLQGTCLILGHIDATGFLVNHTGIRIAGQLGSCRFNFGVRRFGIKKIERTM